MNRARARYGNLPDLASVPPDEWKNLAGQGFDLVWLMGLWQRSPEARQIALREPSLQQAFDTILPGWTPEDVTGSPYAVYQYTPDAYFGSTESIQKLRETLNKSGMKLILDFVPNHLALDHPAVLSNPEFFVSSDAQEAQREPEIFFKTPGGRYLAHGKDPHFLPWSDTVQVNIFSSPVREFMIRELLRIAEIADGVRCDMAMLLLKDIFSQTWKKYLTGFEAPKTEFWEEAITRVKKKNPDFVFIAEVYWGREWQLQQTGFDFTYDKILYDRLFFDDAASVRAHLTAEPDYQNHSMRFIENHDEFRAAAAFGPEKSRAAAVIAATVPGMRFFQDGQIEGKKIHLPVQLGREPEEKPDSDSLAFYRTLLAYADAPVLHQGTWKLLEADHANLLAWAWRRGNECRAVAVNYSDQAVSGRVQMPGGEREVQLKPWGYLLLEYKV